MIIDSGPADSLYSDEGYGRFATKISLTRNLRTRIQESRVSDKTSKLKRNSLEGEGIGGRGRIRLRRQVERFAGSNWRRF
jgi:hypothetical protein